MDMESEDLGWLEADLDLHDDYIDEDFEPPLPEQQQQDEEPQPKPITKPILSIPNHHITNPIPKPNLSIPNDDDDDYYYINGAETESLHQKKRLLNPNPSLLNSTNIEQVHKRSDSETESLHQKKRLLNPSLLDSTNIEQVHKRSDSETESFHQKKRLLNPSLLDSTNIEQVPKRTDSETELLQPNKRLRDSIDDFDDEWMRYSPRPTEGVADVVVEDVMEEKEKERFISRFATDIDGDFMPVTAPDGDRVYAKLVKEDDDKMKKMEVKGRFEGYWSNNMGL